MPRAPLSPARQAIRQRQLLAASERDAAGAIEAAVQPLISITTGLDVPAIDASLTDLDARVTALGG